MCEPLQKLTSSKTLWTWNASYQALFDKAKSVIKGYVCMNFYSETKPLYLETDMSGIGLEATLLQTRNGATCLRNMAPYIYQSHSQVKAWPAWNGETVTSKERCLVYCMGLKDSAITAFYHKTLVAIFKKDVATLSQRIQHILLRIHQFRVRIL